jgi:uncharacterized protein
MTAPDSSFADRYGPWALIAGASEGIGAAHARRMAQLGLNVVLLARRQAVLDGVAASIRAEFGVEAKPVAVDFTQDDALAKIIDATAGLDVGMVAYAAGGDPNYEPFLARPVEVAVGMVKRNCLLPVQLCHHFAGPMRARGRGGIVFFSSGAGMAGSANMVAYGASKAFDIVMAEALWAELHGAGVDVLVLVLGPTDTPALRTILTRRGVLERFDAPFPFPVQTPEHVVTEAAANLGKGPTLLMGYMMKESDERRRTMSRSEIVRFNASHSGGIMNRS